MPLCGRRFALIYRSTSIHVASAHLLTTRAYALLLPALRQPIVTAALRR